MAFTKAPSQSTYQTKDVKLIWSLDNREATLTKDFISLNGFYELTKSPATKDDTYSFVKREGITPYMYTLADSNIRGTYYWEDQDKLFIAYDDKIAIVVGSTGVLSTTVTPFTTTTGDVGFTEFYYDDGSSKVVAGDGAKLITIDSANTVVTSADADLPTPFEPHILFLDGYLFMIKDGTSDIYNSELNNPLSWVPGDFITAEMLPDTLIRISRLSNYLIAFGSASVEYFFDAGNASGSPLQRNDTPVKSVGYLNGFATHANKIYFIGQSATTSPELYVLEDFKIDVVENPMLRRYIQKDTEFTASIVSNGGHTFYVLTLTGVTFALDTDSKVWVRWGYQSESTLPIAFSTIIPIDGSGHCSVFALEGKDGMFFFNPAVYQDSSTNFPVVCQTPKQRFDSMHEKFMSRLIVLADRTTGNLDVSWSDDDYATYTTARTVDLSLKQPKLDRLGAFVARAFKFSFTNNSALKIDMVEVDYNIGGR